MPRAFFEILSIWSGREFTYFSWKLVDNFFHFNFSTPLVKQPIFLLKFNIKACHLFQNKTCCLKLILSLCIIMDNQGWLQVIRIIYIAILKSRLQLYTAFDLIIQCTLPIKLRVTNRSVQFKEISPRIHAMYQWNGDWPTLFYTQWKLLYHS